MSNQIKKVFSEIGYGSKNVTPSEKYLQRLCKNTFLNLWSYPNIYRDQATNGDNEGKEVCDLLVVFDKHVLIFSDKNCIFPNTGDLDLDWSRWVKRAIIKSAEQLYGAERWIKKFPNRLFLDHKCTQPFPIHIPNVHEAKFYRILVAHGSADRCRSEMGGSGSLMIHSSIIGDMHFRKIDDGGIPFAVGQIDCRKGYIHILDDFSIEILLKTLDTISDFVSYLDKKEKLFTSDSRVFAAGEEDLLGYYYKFLDDQGEHDFVFEEKFDTVVFDEGFWEEYIRSPEYESKLKANQISYAWDSLIELFCFYSLHGTQYYSTSPGIQDTEKIMRFMARESRMSRRMLIQSLFEMIDSTPKSMKKARIVKSTCVDGPYYVFLVIPTIKGLSEEEYRLKRYNSLEDHCLVAKTIFPDALDIIGIATDPRGVKYRSEDALYLDTRDWNEDMQTGALSLQNDLKIFTNTTTNSRKVFEFPNPSKNAILKKHRKRHKNK